MAFNLDIVKNHPVAAGAVIIVGGLLIFGVMGGFSGGGAAAAAPLSGSSGTDLAVTQINASLAAQGSDQQFKLAYLAEQQQGSHDQNLLAFTYAEDQLSQQTHTAQDQLAAQVALTQYTTQGNVAIQSKALDVQYAISADTNATALGMQQVLANEQMYSIGQQTALQAKISDNQTLVNTQQIAGNVAIAGQVANVQTAGINAQTAISANNNATQLAIAQSNNKAKKTGGILGFLGAVVGAIL